MLKNTKYHFGIGAASRLNEKSMRGCPRCIINRIVVLYSFRIPFPFYVHANSGAPAKQKQSIISDEASINCELTETHFSYCNRWHIRGVNYFVLCCTPSNYCCDISWKLASQSLPSLLHVRPSSHQQNVSFWYRFTITFGKLLQPCSTKSRPSNLFEKEVTILFVSGSIFHGFCSPLGPWDLPTNWSFEVLWVLGQFGSQNGTQTFPRVSLGALLHWFSRFPYI